MIHYARAMPPAHDGSRWAPPSYVRVWLLFVFAWIVNYLVRMGFAALLPAIIADLALSYTAAGVLASVFFVTYALVQFPAGLLGDRFGRRRVLLLGLLVGAVAGAATGLAGSFAGLLAARAATGLAQGCLFANDRAIIAAVTPPARMALGQAVSFTGPGLGLALGLLVGGLLGDAMPWQQAFVVAAAPSLVAALLIWRFVPAPPPTPARAPLLRRLGTVATHGDLWRLALPGFAVMWVQYVLATWAPLLFREAGVTDLGRAGLYASLVGLGGVGGLLLGGWLGDRAARAGWGQRAAVLGHLAAVSASMTALALVVEYAPTVPTLAPALVLVSLAAWGVWGPSFALLGTRFAGPDLATAFGLYNTACAAGAFVGPALTGWARDVTGSFAAGCAVAAAVAVLALAGARSLPAPARPAPRARLGSRGEAGGPSDRPDNRPV